MNKLFRHSLLVVFMASIAALLTLSSCKKSKLNLQDFYNSSYSPDRFELRNEDSMLLVDSIPSARTMDKVSEDLEAFFKKNQKTEGLFTDEDIKSAARHTARILGNFQHVFIQVGAKSDSHAMVVKVRYKPVISQTVNVACESIKDGKDTIFAFFSDNLFAGSPLLQNSNDDGKVLGSIFGDPAQKQSSVSNAFVPVASLRFVRLVKKASDFFPNIAKGGIDDKPKNQNAKRFLTQFGKDNPDILVKIRFYKWY